MSIESFHPSVETWFRTRLGEPTPPQRGGWPLVRAQHALPGAVTLLRTVRRKSEVAAPRAMAHVTAGDPIDYDGLPTPDERGHAAEVRGQSVDVRRRPTW